MQSNSNEGWVYLITNEAMPGLIKIGYTLKTPDERARDLAGTGNPYEYTVKYAVLTKNPRELEIKLHKQFANDRAGKEWFNLSAAKVAGFIRLEVGSDIKNEIKNFLTDGEIAAEKQARQNLKIKQQKQEEANRFASEKQKFLNEQRRKQQNLREKHIEKDVFMGIIIGGFIGVIWGWPGMFFGACAGGLAGLFFGADSAPPPPQ